MAKLTISNHHPVLSYAGEEWSRLLQVAGLNMDKRFDHVWIGTWEELKVCQSQLLAANIEFKWKDSGVGSGSDSSSSSAASLSYSDEFVIIVTEDTVVLAGKSERAALYAVYQYAQETWGVHAVYPGTIEESVTTGEPKSNLERIRWYAPRMERRGFVIETINDPPYLIAMLDWLAKNKINEIFFTFILWDQVGEKIASEITKRGIMVTLGGHSMKFLLSKENNTPTIEADHPYTAKAQLNFQDNEWQAPLLQDIVEYCRNVPNLTRISLWPEDIADRQTAGFLTHYMQFTERLNTYLQDNGLEVTVEHIAYNAGLAWNMLERETAPSADIDTLFAYWGRDYQYGYGDTPHESDHRASAAFEDWTRELKQTERKLTIFEYYSDHYMLTNLFPFLPQRILKDVAYYEAHDVFGMVNLVVPYRGPDPYPWKWVHGFNSYVFCKAMWSNNLAEILNDYHAFYPDNERAQVKELFELIEAKLAGMTYWNVPLFPARIVDETARASEEQKEKVLTALADISSSIRAFLAHQSELTPLSKPYFYAQHIIDYSEMLYQRWLEQ